MAACSKVCILKTLVKKPSKQDEAGALEETTEVRELSSFEQIDTTTKHA